MKSNEEIAIRVLEDLNKDLYLMDLANDDGFCYHCYVRNRYEHMTHTSYVIELFLATGKQWHVQRTYDEDFKTVLTKSLSRDELDYLDGRGTE